MRVLGVFQVLGVEWIEIQLEKDDHRPKGMKKHYNGYCDTGQFRIYLSHRVDGKPGAMSNTLMHERLHATFFVAGVTSYLIETTKDAYNKEETLCDLLAHAMLSSEVRSLKETPDETPPDETPPEKSN